MCWSWTQSNEDHIKDITVPDNCAIATSYLTREAHPSTAQTRGEVAEGNDKWKQPICEQQWTWKGKGAILVAGRSSELLRNDVAVAVTAICRPAQW
jgi:hypothetical protein